MTFDPNNPLSPPSRPPLPKAGFVADFKRFFRRGLEALLPTLITLFVLAWLWGQLNDRLGRHIITGLRYATEEFASQPGGHSFDWSVFWQSLPPWVVEVVGVLLAIVLVYIVGLFVGNLMGRTIWRLAEMAAMRIPLVRAIYPAVKQVTDFLLADRRRSGQFAQSHVVAVQPHEKGIWSIGLVTGTGLRSLSQSVGEDMVTVFIPSSPTAFSGYVLVVPRRSVVELPLSVEEAMRLLVSGGVISPRTETLPPAAASPQPAAGRWPAATAQTAPQDSGEDLAAIVSEK